MFYLLPYPPICHNISNYIPFHGDLFRPSSIHILESEEVTILQYIYIVQKIVFVNAYIILIFFIFCPHFITTDNICAKFNSSGDTFSNYNVSITMCNLIEIECHFTK